MTGEGAVAAVRRAERFALVLAVRYRKRGTRPWTDGLSVDVSRKGLLFTTEGPVLSCGECIDLLIRLPGPHGAHGGEARCTGRVVRVVPASAARCGTAIAATIDRYVLKRRRAMPAGVGL